MSCSLYKRLFFDSVTMSVSSENYSAALIKRLRVL